MTDNHNTIIPAVLGYRLILAHKLLNVIAWRIGDDITVSQSHGEIGLSQEFVAVVTPDGSVERAATPRADGLGDYRRSAHGSSYSSVE